MNFGQAVQSGLKNYVNFEGRASASEYWWFTLFHLIATILPFVLAFFAAVSAKSMGWVAVILVILGFVIMLGLILPQLSVLARRLHDSDRSAAWILIGFIPTLVAIVLIVFACMPSTPAANKYGPAPGNRLADTFS